LLAPEFGSWQISVMTARDVIAEFEELPAAERAIVAKFVVEHEDSWIPDDFQQGMADIAEGREVDLDMVLNDEQHPDAS
jgi:hypothetical protein